MKKDFRNSTYSIFLSTLLVLIGWMFQRYVDGDAFQKICFSNLCLPLVYLVGYAALALLIAVILIYISE